ncbi:MAG: gluconokinase [Pseudomonadota bacterium]
MRCFVIMGVAGCGKTTVGEALAARTGVCFVDGDALHPPGNIEKMSRGVPLDDADRAPWLSRVGLELAQREGNVAVGCSALKRAYRDMIRARAGEPVCFLHLYAEQPVIAARMAKRSGHFMPTSLLDSQFDALERLQSDETGHAIDIDNSFEAVVAEAAQWVREAVA